MPVQLRLLVWLRLLLRIRLGLLLLRVRLRVLLRVMLLWWRGLRLRRRVRRLLLIRALRRGVLLVRRVLLLRRRPRGLRLDRLLGDHGLLFDLGLGAAAARGRADGEAPVLATVEELHQGPGKGGDEEQPWLVNKGGSSRTRRGEDAHQTRAPRPAAADISAWPFLKR